MARMLPRTFTFKDDVRLDNITMVSPHMLYLFGAFSLWCHNHQLPVRITSIIDDYKGERISSSHSDGRAIDVSVANWPPDKIQQAVRHFNREYTHIAAISKRDGKPRAIVYHRVDGGAYHLHLQVRPISHGE